MFVAAAVVVGGGGGGVYFILFFYQRATPSKNTCVAVKSIYVSGGRDHIQGNAEMIGQNTLKGWVTRLVMRTLRPPWADEAHLCYKR